MKYWRGYLVAGILGLFTWGLMEFAKTHQNLIDMIYPYVTRMIQTALASWSGGVDFLLWQFLAIVLVVVLLATIVLMVVLRWNFIQWLGWVAACGSLVFLLHTGVYGLNQYAGSIAADIQMDVVDYTVTDLKDATLYYRDKANSLAAQVSRDASGNPQFPSFEELAEQAGESFRIMTYEKGQPIFAGSHEPVKPLGWADMYTSMGITGFHFALTGEAAVNPQIPVVSLPFTMCHEMAHRACIASERDANFAAFLACSTHPNVEFQYSAYFMAYRYCYNALASVTTSAGAEAAAEVRGGVSDVLQQDLTAYNNFFAQNKDEQAEKIGDTVNDTYLKVSGNDRGTQSYGDVCDLLVSWHIQEVILPQQQETVIPFDPYDKTQVNPPTTEGN